MVVILLDFYGDNSLAVISRMQNYMPYVEESHEQLQKLKKGFR